MEIDSDIPDSAPDSGGIVSGLLFFWDFIKVIIVALAIILPIRYFVFQPFIVDGQSMEPNFYDDQYLVIDRLSYRFRDPTRGEVLVVKDPSNQKQYFIKRIVGLPEEKIELDGSGKVKIYNAQNPKGFVLDESDYLDSQTSTFALRSTIVGGKNILTLKKGEYFMLGDNRMASSDSRDWGPLTSDRIVGRVVVRALPLSDFKVFSSPAYGSN